MRGKGSMDNNDMNSIQYTENGNSGIVVDTKEEKKQSGLGIASFVMSMVNIAMIISIFVASFKASANVYTVDSSLLVLVGLLSILCVILSVVGTVLGTISVCQKNKKKVFGIIGLVINGCELALMILIFAIGFASM